MMTMRQVDSSFIDEIGHDPETNVCRVILSSGKQYDHSPVSADEFEDFASAPSVGAHYNKHIKTKGNQ